MKDKILNILMLLSVAAALLFTLLNEKNLPAQPVLSLPSVATLAPTATPRPIDSYRARRESTRKEELTVLSALSENPLAEEEIRKMAQMQLTEITQRNETELAVEAALIARGYADALCIFQSGSLTILLTETLTEQDAQWIFALASEISSLKMENIRISAC